MATIRILRDTSIKGVPAFVGDVVEVDEADARLLTGYGLAEPYEGMDEESVEDLSTIPTKKKRRT